jgi:NitT/TauT family transport system substrate-binding protein
MLGIPMDKKILITIAVATVVLIAAVAAALLMTQGTKEKGGTVYYITVAPKDMKAALSTGQIDAYIAWEPYVSDSVEGDVGSVLEWSSQIMPNHPCCVVAVSNSFVAGTNGPELTDRFVKAHIDATKWMNDALSHKDGANYTLLVNMAVQFTQRNETVVKAAFGHLQYGYDMGSNFRSALQQFTDMYISTNMTSNQTMTNRGYSGTADFINKYVNGSYLTSAGAIAPSSTILNPSSPIRLGYLLGDLHQMAQVVAQNHSILSNGKSMFEDYGLLVTNATGAPFANGGAEMNGFAAGSVDVGYLGAAPAILNHLNSAIGTTIVAQANSEGSGIVVKVGSGISDLSGLVNKTIATPGESSIQFLLLKIALQKEGIDLKIKT